MESLYGYDFIVYKEVYEDGLDTLYFWGAYPTAARAKEVISIIKNEYQLKGYYSFCRKEDLYYMEIENVPDEILYSCF